MPLFPDTVLKKSNRSGLVRAKIDLKVAQQLLRHATLRVAMDIYAPSGVAERRTPKIERAYHPIIRRSSLK